MSSSCPGPVPVALGPLEAPADLPASACAHPSPPRCRRPRRVLYPASRSRRPRVKEAPDHARRWLLLLSALVFLQIYTEETHTCADLQSQRQDPAVCPAHDGEASPDVAWGQTAEEPRRVHTVGGASSKAQPECVVA